MIWSGEKRWATGTAFIVLDMTDDIAELLKVSETTVRGLIHEGELRAIRFGREFRVAVKDLEAFVNAHATRPPAPEPDSDRTWRSPA